MFAHWHWHAHAGAVQVLFFVVVVGVLAALLRGPDRRDP